MKIKCGYNCINLSMGKNFKNLKLQTISNKEYGKVKTVIDDNILLLGDIIGWNLVNGIRAFRVSSSLIPFIGHPVMLDYLNESELLYRPCFLNECKRIRKLVKEKDFSLTVHPGQYNVLNSLNESVVKRTVKELESQAMLMNLLGGKIIVLHIGGAYGGKNEAKKRFIRNSLELLSPNVLSKLAIENDDKIFNTDDIVEIAKEVGCNWVYDCHHESINPSKNLIKNLNELKPIKYHISEGVPRANKRPHNAWVSVHTVNRLIHQIEYLELDEILMMFEAKNKDLTLLDTMQCESCGYWVPRNINKRFIENI